jgi:MATE family multidrug resistance protein
MSYNTNVSKSYLFQLSIPIFFSNLAVPLVGLTDTFLMGHMESEKFLAATSISTAVMTMILWSFGFLRMGTVGIVAQCLGRGDYRGIILTIFRNFIIALVISILIILLKPIIINLINKFYLPTTETKDLINDYISVRIFSAPAELGLYIVVGLFLGLQKTRVSSLIIASFCILNIILSILFVKKYNLGITGVALGTLAAAYVVCIIALMNSFWFVTAKFNLKLKTTNVFILEKFLLQFIMLASFFLDAYAFSTEGVIGYTIGRKTKKNFYLAVKNSIQLSSATGLAIAFVFFILFKPIVHGLTDIDYLRYLAYGYFLWIILIPPVASFCYQLDGIFIGAAQTAEMRNGMFVSVTFFIVASYYLVQTLSNHGLWLSFLMFMILRALTLYFYFSRIEDKFN